MRQSNRPVVLLVWSVGRHSPLSGCAGWTYQPLLGERDTLWRKFRVWGGLVYGIIAMPVIGFFAGAYGLHFCVMVAAAVWIATRKPQAAA